MHVATRYNISVKNKWQWENLKAVRENDKCFQVSNN